LAQAIWQWHGGAGVRRGGGRGGAVAGAESESKRVKGREKQMEAATALRVGPWPCSHEHGRGIDT
jgi:hypothetical protein